MNQYERVIRILDDSIGAPDVGIAAHGAFWRGLKRDEFIAIKVFNYDLVVVGDGASSNLVKALKGQAPFGKNLPNPPAAATMPRMPFGFDPVSADNTGFIEQWISDGCPEDAVPPNEAKAWRPTSAPAARRYDDIWFVTPDVGWAVNGSVHILHTGDGGVSWTEQFHVTADQNAEVWLRCIGFASPSRGWVGTTSGEDRLFEAKDGGTTWTPVADLPAGAPDAVCGLSVVNESVVYASGINYPNPRSGPPPRMMTTVDGGLAWEAWHITDHASLLVDTYFSSPHEGRVVGGKAQPLTAGQKKCTKRPDGELAGQSVWRGDRPDDTREHLRLGPAAAGGVGQ